MLPTSKSGLCAQKAFFSNVGERAGIDFVPVDPVRLTHP